MNVFVTGATGWIGSAVVAELLTHHHSVVGLARSDASVAALEHAGATVVRGDLDDLDGLRTGAQAADAVIHLANKHDFADPEGTNRAERAAVKALGDALAGTGRPFLVASGVTGVGPGRVVAEHDPSPFHGADSLRGGSENLALELARRGVGTRVVRFAPTVHGRTDTGFLAGLVAVARDKGLSGYPADGSSRWAAVHRDDAARLVRLALEHDAEPAAVFHAVAEVGVPSRVIAEAIGRALGLPVASVPGDATWAHFGWLSLFFGQDIAAGSQATRDALGWTPAGPSLVEDLDSGAYLHTGDRADAA